jgi:DNA-binding transcriptional ArsR family regulator
MRHTWGKPSLKKRWGPPTAAELARDAEVNARRRERRAERRAMTPVERADEAQARAEKKLAKTIKRIVDRLIELAERNHRRNEEDRQRAFERDAPWPMKKSQRATDPGEILAQARRRSEVSRGIVELEGGASARDWRESDLRDEATCALQWLVRDDALTVVAERASSAAPLAAEDDFGDAEEGAVFAAAADCVTDAQDEHDEIEGRGARELEEDEERVEASAAEEHESVFQALSSAARRRMLDGLYQRNGRTIAQLGRHARLSHQAATKHVLVLERAGLVRTLRRGRRRYFYLDPVRLHETYMRWFDKFERDALRLLREWGRVFED